MPTIGSWEFLIILVTLAISVPVIVAGGVVSLILLLRAISKQTKE